MYKSYKKYLRSISIVFRLFAWKINRKIRKKFTVKTKQGIFTAYFNDKVIGKSLYCKREYELGYLLEVSSFLNSKQLNFSQGTILDIGANNGVISIGMLKRNLVKKAIAIEPDPTNYELLKENSLLNNLEKAMFCIPSAVSNKKGKAIFELSETNFGDHRIKNENFVSPKIMIETKRKTIEINTDTIDNLLKMAPFDFINNIKIIWIDVQGHEGYVLKEGKEIFSKGIPTLLEICPKLLERAGMKEKEFESILKEFWNDFWIFRRNRFVKYPLSVLSNYFNKIGYSGAYENIILI